MATKVWLLYQAQKWKKLKNLKKKKKKKGKEELKNCPVLSLINILMKDPLWV